MHYISVSRLAVVEGVVAPLPFSNLTSFSCTSITVGLIAAKMFDGRLLSGKHLLASSASWNGIVNNGVTGQYNNLHSNMAGHRKTHRL